jgi:ABC-type antimicrobial peptide transport system permease subunit
LTPHKSRLLQHGASDDQRTIVLTWRRTVKMCWSSVRNRLGRSMLTFLGIAIVAAFFMSSFSYQIILHDLMQRQDTHTQAVLEQAGVFTHDAVSLKRQRDQRIWLMALSAIVCLTGITNTILMSVTERVREIGTLKCLGALDRFIVRLFLVENLFLGLLGSLTGAVTGFFLALLQVGMSLQFRLISMPTAFHALAVAGPVSVAAGALLTVLAAVYPTYVAARMRPVDAMRVEV